METLEEARTTIDGMHEEVWVTWATWVTWLGAHTVLDVRRRRCGLGLVG